MSYGAWQSLVNLKELTMGKQLFEREDNTASSVQLATDCDKLCFARFAHLPWIQLMGDNSAKTKLVEDRLILLIFENWS